MVPTDGIEAIGDGILFDDGVFLKWGSDVERDKLYKKKEFRADRAIYHWGERSILNGLTLYFRTICWNQKQHGNFKSFEGVEFVLEGHDADEKFLDIKTRLESIFGEAKYKEDVQPGDVSLEWRVKAVKISLDILNKEWRKVRLEIGLWL